MLALPNGDVTVVTWGDYNHNYDLQILSSTGSVVADSAAPGSYEVTVESEDALGQKTSATRTIDVLPQPPTVAKVEPSVGSASGGGHVKITGTNLDGATAVRFG